MNSNLKIFKAVLFSFIVNLLMVTVMLLHAHNMVSNVISLILTLGILIVSCVLFSPIKGDIEHFLRYNIVAILSYIVFISLTLLILGCVYKGWETAMFFWTEMFSFLACFVSVVIDTISCFANKKISK